MKRFDFSHGIPSGERYGDQYGAWLELFRKIAESSDPVKVISPPSSWVPFLIYIGANVEGWREHFLCDAWLSDPISAYKNAVSKGRQREYVEHVCALRPELVDSLWKVDAQWKAARVDHTEQREFIVTTYNAWYRPEIQKFLERLKDYRVPEGIKNCVITNCAADKPYPSPLHRAIRSVLPDKSWHLVIATGVLGVVPEELWDVMPLYDAGIPNFSRCTEQWELFLPRVNYDRIIVFTEMYSQSVERAFRSVSQEKRDCVNWVLKPDHYKDYLPLESSEYIERLRRAIQNEVMV